MCKLLALCGICRRLEIPVFVETTRPEVETAAGERRRAPAARQLEDEDSMIHRILAALWTLLEQVVICVQGLYQLLRLILGKKGKKQPPLVFMRTAHLSVMQRQGYWGEETQLYPALHESYVYMQLTDDERECFKGTGALAARLCQPQGTAGGKLSEDQGEGLLREKTEEVYEDLHALAEQFMDKIARQVLYVALKSSALPESAGSVAGFKRLLEQPLEEGGQPLESSGVLHVDVGERVEGERPGWPDWHVDQGLITVIWTQSKGLQVRGKAGTVLNVDHGDGGHVVVLAGHTLQVALQGDIMARHYRTVREDEPPPITLVYQLRAHPDKQLDAELLSRPPGQGPQATKVRDAYAKLPKSIPDRRRPPPDAMTVTFRNDCRAETLCQVAPSMKLARVCREFTQYSRAGNNLTPPVHHDEFWFGGTEAFSTKPYQLTHRKGTNLDGKTIQGQGIAHGDTIIYL